MSGASRLLGRRVDVPTIHQSHPRIRAKDWSSPLVLRLLRNEPYRDADDERLQDSVRLPGESAGRNANLFFGWKGVSEDVRQCANTYQAPVLTEFATLGLACALAQVAGREITEVTRRGERADFWIGDRECMLEVSGQIQGNLESLRDDKADQLLSNPYEKPGFVCVANYSERQAYFWYYEQGDEP